jgi:hypothetical protein
MSPRAWAACALLLASACGRDPAVPSAEQNSGMNEAEKLLNQAPDTLETVDDAVLNAPAAAQNQ